MGVVLKLDSQTQASLQRHLGRLFKNDVPDTPELRRVLGLPRRVWEDERFDDIGGLEDLALMMTAFLKAPGGTQTLRLLQAKALQEAHDFGSLLGPIPVGEGKTLVTFLAPVLLRAERPVLVVSAKLGRKTRHEFAELAKHWQSHPRYLIVSYEKLGREGATELLELMNPDLFVFDEVHKLKNRDAAVTRRIARWVSEHSPRVVALSGTITSRSLLDFAHVLGWCMAPGLRPLPQRPRELEAWAAAVDEIKGTEQRLAAGIGALVLFCNDEERERGRDGVRAAVRRRIQETPGVVASEGSDVKASLNIGLTLVEGYGPRIYELAERLNRGEKPNGDVVTDDDLSTRWRVTRTLTSGFWYDWVPKPPVEWREARSAWKKCVSRHLREHIPGLESELLVTKAVANGELGNYEDKARYLRWQKVKDSYEPNVVPVWEDDTAIEHIARWTAKHTGIIWVSETALGERLEEKLGLPYYHRLGLNRKKEPIESTPTTRSIVASVASNSEGRNLQAWNDNLVVSPPPTGTVWEQMLGRTHRFGQQADEVWFEVLIGCRVEFDCWQQAVKDARYASSIESKKKLTYATIMKDFEFPYGNSLWQTNN